MSRELYDFLADSRLFQDLNDLLKDEAALTAELEAYWQHAAECYPAIMDRLGNAASRISVYLPTLRASEPPLVLIKRSAIYHDAMILDDPLSLEYRHNAEMNKAHAQFLGLPPTRGDVQAVADAALFMKELTPLVAAGIVNFVPIKLVRELGRSIPIRYSPSLFADAIPTELLPWFRERALVHPLTKSTDGSGWFHRPGEELRPSRGIIVEFPGHEGPAAVYFLAEGRATAFNETTGMATFLHTLPEHAPEPDRFRLWVEQSVNSTAAGVLDALVADVEAAQSTAASIATTSPGVAPFQWTVDGWGS